MMHTPNANRKVLLKTHNGIAWPVPSITTSNKEGGGGARQPRSFDNLINGQKYLTMTLSKIQIFHRDQNIHLTITIGKILGSQWPWPFFTI